MPDPVNPGGPDAQYQARLAQGEFAIQRCQSCERHIFYPRILCPACGATSLDWVAASGRGTVYTTSVVRRRSDRGGDYNVAIVELAEGPRMLTRIEGVEPMDVAIGMSVTAKITGEEEKYIVFEADGGA